MISVEKPDGQARDEIEFLIDRSGVSDRNHHIIFYIDPDLPWMVPTLFPPSSPL